MKSKPLTIVQKRKIARHKAKFPELSTKSIAELFHVQYDQARRAINDYRAGKFNIEKTKKKTIEINENTETPEELFDKQFHTALVALDNATSLGAIDRISALDKIAKIRKVNQTIKLEGHIKRADAGIIAAIIRRYEPDASDELIIQIFREETEKIKNEY